MKEKMLELGQPKGAPFGFHMMCPYDDVPERNPPNSTLYDKVLNGAMQGWVKASKINLLGTGSNGEFPCLGKRHCGIYPCSELVKFSEEMKK